MGKNKQIICNICTNVGFLSLLMYISLTLVEIVLIVVGSSTRFFVFRLTSAGIAVVAYAIRWGVEIASKDKEICKKSALMVVISAADIALVAIAIWLRG